MTEATILATPAKWPRFLLPAGSGHAATSRTAAGNAGDAEYSADPTDLDAATARGAFSALRTAIEELHAEGVLAAVEKSGLRGRGTGTGIPAAAKWRACAVAEVDRQSSHAGRGGRDRYVVVNAYQSDPAVLIDRVLIETNPYAVIEGAAIAAVAVGASAVIVAVRAEAVDTIAVLESACAAARSAGYLGFNVMGSSIDIEFEIRPLQGAYMLGEETVLLKGLEGKRGQPEQQPPYPTTRGLFGRPTLIHGPQTFAAVPPILSGGEAVFAETGTDAGHGTALVQISGAVPEPGIAEVPLGTPIREILALAGVPARHNLKAVLVGGPSGALLPPEALALRYDQETLRTAGAHIGSGSIVAIDASACVVDLATALTRFCADQACGKTIPCRIGLRRLAEIGARICDGEPRGDELTRMADLSADIVASGLCDHERRATLALASVVRHFRDELDAHLLRNECPAGICRPAAGAHARAVS